MLAKMLITLCYVYLWVRFHKCYSMLIRNSLSRLNSSSSSFSFSVCSSSTSAPTTAPSTGRHTAARRQPSRLPTEDSVFLQLGDRAVYVTEPQVWYWRQLLTSLNDVTWHSQSVDTARACHSLLYMSHLAPELLPRTRVVETAAKAFKCLYSITIYNSIHLKGLSKSIFVHPLGLFR